MISILNVEKYEFNQLYFVSVKKNTTKYGEKIAKTD